MMMNFAAQFKPRNTHKHLQRFHKAQQVPFKGLAEALWSDTFRQPFIAIFCLTMREAATICHNWHFCLVFKPSSKHRVGWINKILKDICWKNFLLNLINVLAIPAVTPSLTILQPSGLHREISIISWRSYTLYLTDSKIMLHTKIS